MRRIVGIISLISLAGALNLSGQQLPHYTQYMFNDFVINPAIAGTHDYYQIRTNHRFQWVGMVDPPLTNTLSFYGPHAQLDMGFGGFFYNDITGPTSRTGVGGSYAYNIAINRDIRLSMGVSLSMLQYKIDGTQLNPKDASDQFIQGVISTTYVPDGSIGVYLYADEFYAGFSVAQLFNNKLKIFEEKTGLNKLKSHFYLTGGYRYEVDRDWILEPSLILKATAPREFSFDINAKVEWQKMVWGAVGYRFHEAISVMAGYSYDEKFYFGYAYDIGITDLRKYNAGTHEIMIGYRFNSIK